MTEDKKPPCWVRVGPHLAIISYALKRPRRGVPFVPTWLVLGPMPADRKPRATLAAGTVMLDDAGKVHLVIQSGDMPAELAPALLEAAQSLVRDHAPKELAR